MRRSVLTTFLFLLLSAAGAPARAQDFNYDAYEPRTLAEMIRKYDSEEIKNPEMGDGSRVFGASFPSRVKVTYTGGLRKISAERKKFIGDWAETHALSKQTEELFESELLFVENKTEYWLPVQKQVVPYFEKELKKGDTIDLYVIIAGGVKVAGKWDWVILVNEFEKE